MRCFIDFNYYLLFLNNTLVPCSIKNVTNLSRSNMSKRLTKRYLTSSDRYECPLSSDTQAVALEELRETVNARSQALDALRKWLEQNPKFMAIRMGMLECNVFCFELSKIWLVPCDLHFTIFKIVIFYFILFNSY